MIKKSEGIINIASGLIVGFYFLLPNLVIRYAAIYLIIKSAVYLILYSPREWIAFIDGGIGIYLVILSFGSNITFITILISLYLLVRGSIEVFGLV